MRSILALVALALVASGCAKEDNKQSVSDAHSSISTDSTMRSGGMAGSMTMSGDMKKDMSMMNDMMVRDLGQGDSLYDRRFIDMMISHHEGAIMMAEDALSKATHPEIKKLAQNIIGAQKKEIAEMVGWRHQWYGH